ncbi:arginine-tRNA-protein transferase [Rhodofomes roseus]|uniref:arginyltransferase n=1 Tax=Rhodofomes roseus TaxID=34475 RepID=A0ABQ8KX75_9APHY|nr:arginine-tRNA-protein transferase [Rhodofomes roseus]KAH9843904.1 arginine-tRNA-protein transferase [Rhodofomes roseus]
MERTVTILAPLTPHNSTCGYCSPPGKRSETKSSCHAAECIPLRMSCEGYQKMIDRGWRRSGTYCYKPDLKKSCCPQYTIRLDANKFKPSKSQRKLLNRWNRFVLRGDTNEEAFDEATSIPKKGSPHKGKKTETAFSLTQEIHASEHDFCTCKSPKHRFEVTLEPSSFTDEKFDLYQSYQRNIHCEEDKMPSSFKRFLVETPLQRETIPYPSPPPSHLPQEYGSYHQLYRLDGELIAMGVIDVLPNCVSSVYFMYEKKWEKHSLGKLSALREASLAKEMYDTGLTDMGFLYMGFYIHSCPKMRYKGDYAPSYLADPEEYTWCPFEQCRPALEGHRYVSFAHPEHNLEGPPDVPEDDSIQEQELPASVLSEAHIIQTGRRGGAVAVPVITSPQWRRSQERLAISALLNGLGPELAAEVLLFMAYEL